MKPEQGPSVLYWKPEVDVRAYIQQYFRPMLFEPQQPRARTMNDCLGIPHPTTDVQTSIFPDTAEMCTRSIECITHCWKSPPPETE